MIETFYHLSESVSAEAQGGSRKSYAPVSRSGGRSFQDYLTALKSDASSSFKTAGARQTGEGVYRPESYDTPASYRQTLHGDQQQGGSEGAAARERSGNAALRDQRREDANRFEARAAEAQKRADEARETEATKRRQAAERRAQEARADERRQAEKSRSEAEQQDAKKAAREKQAGESERARSEGEKKAANKADEKQQSAENAENADKENAKAKNNEGEQKNKETAQAKEPQNQEAAKAAQEANGGKKSAEESSDSDGKDGKTTKDAKSGDEHVQKNGDGNSAAEKAAAQAAEQSSKNARDKAAGKSEENREESGGKERQAAEEQAAAAAGNKADNFSRSSGGGQNSAQRSDGDELNPRGRAAAEQGSRGRGKGESGNKLTVVDMRRDGGGSRSEESGSGGSGNSGNGSSGESRGRSGDFSKLLQQNGLKSEKGGTDQSQTMQFDVRTAGSGNAAGGAGKSAGKANNSLFSQLRQQLGDEIVKKSTIMVRENGSGEIRLNLRPENLGSVRIRITLEDNHIAGKIFVDNQNVRDAFEQNLQNLQRSFREHGFEDASLDVSVGEERRGRHGGKKNGSAEKSASTQAAKAMGEQVPDADSGYGDEQIIDLVV